MAVMAPEKKIQIMIKVTHSIGALSSINLLLDD